MASNNGNQIEARLWEAADELRANSKLKASEYSVPVLGLVFLRYADFKFQIVAEELEGTSTGRRPVATRFDTLVTGPMLYQPKHIANFSLGFNRKGLNVWLSYQYNGMIFTDKNL